MVRYTRTPDSYVETTTGKIASFISSNGENIDERVVESFGQEWKKFSRFTDDELEVAGRQYFDIVTEEMIHRNALVLDAGCGNGRWSRYISKKVKFIEAIDVSSSVIRASEFLSDCNNVRVTRASVSDLPFPDQAFDFIMSIGVLHHLPDTEQGIRSLVTKLKQGGYMYLYLYYNMENKGMLYKTLYHLSDFFRIIISSLPQSLKKPICDLIAIFVYLPFVLLGKLVKTLVPRNNLYRRVPLSYYTDKSFNTIRNDALDRFGTPLEKRFSKKMIEQMMIRSGLGEIIFSNNEPYWHCVRKRL